MPRSFLARSKSNGAYLFTFGSASAVCTAARAFSSAALGCGTETQAPSARANPTAVIDFVFMTASLLIGLGVAQRLLPQRLQARVQFVRRLSRAQFLRGRLGQLRVGSRLLSQLGCGLGVVAGCRLLG